MFLEEIPAIVRFRQLRAPRLYEATTITCNPARFEQDQQYKSYRAWPGILIDSKQKPWLIIAWAHEEKFDRNAAIRDYETETVSVLWAPSSVHLAIFCGRIIRMQVQLSRTTIHQWLLHQLPEHNIGNRLLPGCVPGAVVLGTGYQIIYARL